VLCAVGTFAYFVEWQDAPGVPVFILAARLRPSRSDEALFSCQPNQRFARLRVRSPGRNRQPPVQREEIFGLGQLHQQCSRKERTLPSKPLFS
jgi:hypothetical protein